MIMVNNTDQRNDFDVNYTDESHIKAFQDALSYDDQQSLNDDNQSMYTNSRSNSTVGLSGISNFPQTPSLNNIETITSKSDWKPVYNKTRKRKSIQENFLNDETSITFNILRYPLLTFTIIWVTILSILYFFVRLLVSISEKIVTSNDKKRKVLTDNLNNSANYIEYIENAKKLDEYLGLDSWCKEDRYKYYDWKTLRKTVNNLKKLRHLDKIEDLMLVLQSCIKSNFAGTENPIMYSHCHYGTKNLIDNYNAEVVKSLNSVMESNKINLSEKRIFFKILNKNFGRTALVLSGGASFCHNHVGVLKALIENDLMPKIISGTSGGGMIAALTATRTNEEMLKLINPKLAHRMDAFGDESMLTWIKRWWKTGARFDSVEWAKKAQWWTKGSLTFKECYQKNGKILNISTVPHDMHSPTILCNYITSPQCVIWSAMLASAAVPGILNPVVLMEKLKNGQIKPFSLGSKWKDGSLRTDVPLSSLNTYFNMKFSIVSQVNPHVMLWIFKNRGDIGKPIVRSKGKTYRGGFILSYLENLIKLEIIKWLKLVKEFQLFPNILESDWSNLFLQKFGGTITLFPKIVLSDYMYILSDPTEERLGRIIKNGEAVTYPRLLFIKHRLNIEKIIESGLEKCKVDINSASTMEAIIPTELKTQNIIDNLEINRTPSADDVDDDDDQLFIENDDSFDDKDDGNMSDSNMGFLGILPGPGPIVAEDSYDIESDDSNTDENKKEI